MPESVPAKDTRKTLTFTEEGSSGSSRTGGAVRSGASVPANTAGAAKAAGATGPSADGAASGAETTGGANATKKSGAQAVPSPRRVRLTLSRIDPWSVMKLSFLVAVAFGVATVICTAILWGVIDQMSLWDKLQALGASMNDNKPLPLFEYFQFTKVISYSIVVSVLNVAVITALGTLVAFLYNIVAALLGGLKLTFTDD
ncbi:DUF3566 domain-containing protein [Devriesea agamarum]|uniref:DUF3566 domain-containing protein n=1 Tax=Devriesea agamarum TaxID=472569 RepID=UPI00071D0BE8|nr:DUF3566 domain-containing protein [Devriesea agamarum]